MLTSTLFLLWATFLQCVVGTEMKRQQRTVMTGAGQLGGTFYYNFHGPLQELCHAQVSFTIPPGNGQPSFSLVDIWCHTPLGNTPLSGARAYHAVRDRGQGRIPSYQDIELGIDIPNQRLYLATGLYRFRGATPRINASVERDGTRGFTSDFRLLFGHARQGATCMADASGTSCTNLKRDPQGGWVQPVVKYCSASC